MNHHLQIKLYKRSRPSADTPFPVALFLSKSFVAFQERLNVGQDVLDIADMLEISSEDFQVSRLLQFYVICDDLEIELRIILF